MGKPAAQVTGDAGSVRAAPARSWRNPTWWAWAAVYVLAGVTLFFCYWRLSRTQAVTSDGAANALQAWDMLHGNPLLRGWTLSDVSFYTTELPEYLAVELIRGLGPDVVHVAAALTYTLLVLLTGLLAKGRAKGREGIVRVLIASGIMIAPQLWPGAFILLLSPDHTGTQVPLLLTWLVLDRAPRRWYVPVIIAMMLAWVQVADGITVITATVPLVLVCLARTSLGLMRRKPLMSMWYELSLAAAAVASVVVASLSVRVITRLGGYSVRPLIFQFAKLGAIPAQLKTTANGVLALYGAGLSGLHPGVAAAFAVVHLAGMALAGWAFGLALWRFFRLDDLVVQVLTIAIIINLGAFAFSTLPGAAYSIRQIAAVLPLGAVLAGRLLAAKAVRLRLVPALAVVLACYIAALGYGVTRPAVPAQGQDLANWLVTHHLNTGLGGVEGNVTTLDTGGRAQLLVTSFGWSGAAPDAYESKASWYDRRLHYADFVVTTEVSGAYSVPYQQVVADFGPPVRIYHFRGYAIFIWPKNLLADLGAPRSQ
jgi:hypothetical protein